MIRPILIVIGLFLTPFVVYAVVLMATRVDMRQRSAWTMQRVGALVIAALILVVAGFVMLAQFSGAPPGSTYVPAHMEDGKFVPGATR
jgi:hypothetical protein